jgi:hypothetical protein
MAGLLAPREGRFFDTNGNTSNVFNLNRHRTVKFPLRLQGIHEQLLQRVEYAVSRAVAYAWDPNGYQLPNAPGSRIR